MFLLPFSFSTLTSYPSNCVSGIPEIKSVLNGVDATTVLSLEILPWKIVSMCFSVAAGLPLGKEGPMIHAGTLCLFICSYVFKS